ncbi:MAG: CrcB family protein [Bacteriovoracaceae bacterium]|nr:CrcB family protein [Bacteriovoracaceae bacterium]
MMESLSSGLMVFLGGGLGASLRWSTSLVFSHFGFSFWSSTLLVNCLGTLFYFLSLKSSHGQSEFMQLFMRFGFFGALTTFSTFSFEVASAFRSGLYTQAALIFFLNIFAGVLIAIGMFR